MALIFCDGFDHYHYDTQEGHPSGLGIYGDLTKKWALYVVTGDAFYASAQPRWARPPGGQGLRMYARSDRGIYRWLGANYDSFVCGFNFFYESSTMGSGAPIVYFNDSAINVGTNQIEVRGDSLGHIGVYRSGTQLALSSKTMVMGTWYHLEFKATIHPSAGIYELRIDGSSTGWIPEATGKNTRGQTSNNWINAVGLCTDSRNVWFDDFYFLDTSGSVANSFIGPQRIITLRPIGAGNQTDWVGNYASNFVNVGAANGDVVFNRSSVAGDIDLFTFDKVPTGTISGIQHVIEARQDAGVPRVIRPKTRIGSTNYDGLSIPTPGAHRFLTDARSVSPATSSAWSASEVNSTEFGYELES